MPRQPSITQLRAAIRKAPTPEEAGKAEARLMARLCGIGSLRHHLSNAKMDLERIHWRLSYQQADPAKDYPKGARLQGFIWQLEAIGVQSQE